jgi:hypothetical protein
MRVCNGRGRFRIGDDGRTDLVFVLVTPGPVTNSTVSKSVPLLKWYARVVVSVAYKSCALTESHSQNLDLEWCLRELFRGVLLKKPHKFVELLVVQIRDCPIC